MSRLHPTPDARALLEPMWTPLLEAAARLPDAELYIGIGDVPGFAAWDDGRWVLSDKLLGPDLNHPEEPATAPLDRWRRATAAVLEGLAWEALAARGLPRTPGIWEGAAVAMAHVAAPFLELGPTTWAEAAAMGSVAGRRGALLFADMDAPELALAWADGVGAAELTRRVRESMADPTRRHLRGPGVLELPAQLPAWSMARVRARREGRLRDVGALVGPEAEWVAVAEETALAIAPVGVEGGWDLLTTEVPGNILGARGVSMRFYDSGRVDLLFADAFVGPIEALEMAQQMGHSGMTSGSWTATGADRIRFGEFASRPITMHQRDGSQAMPQVGFGVTEWIAAMSGSEWVVDRQGDELRLAGRLMDMPVRLRLGPERL